MQTTQNKFEQFKLNRQLLNAIEEAGYTEPTPIQEQAIPLALSGQDILGIAQTGTGKTAAYTLPLLMRIKYAQGEHARALIMAPTRELAMQISEAIAQLSKYTDIRTVVLFGGVGAKAQIEAIRKGVDIIVATPGRFMDLYFQEEVIVKHLNVMILDEADKMMDMGFMPQIRKLLEIIPTKRQNMLFSATFSDKVERLSFEFLEFPTRIEVTPQATTAEMVSQSIYELPNFRTKINLLTHLLKDREAFNRVLIFTRSREVAGLVHQNLLDRVVREDELKVIHANKGQNTRTNAMEAFKEGSVRVMVATDVVARGIDITEVSHVINFDVPLIYEDYVHRIGRTGRANRIGQAITFMTMADEYHIRKIEKMIRMEIPRMELPEDLEVASTPVTERQDMLREIDNQKRKEDPTFLGAFHEKKKTYRPAQKQPNKGGSNRRNSSGRSKRK
ncbi:MULTISPECIES: DEAD/DEAH box helicase [Dyadobacter]|uniref:DEAD/DEAH box helicase n=1 Tax=Dyadobacter chenhuakuii TaxID=2909339 RepID=A0A9X1QHW7_9BACT|nr:MULTISPECIES: DEAD/DEAH box helicase [Dyadobacter]MCE7068931.1 DEAD/DEAH box helicase [Dyadobacter sp. CY327]MCF2495531.1 DEAD/DEAH box helicase [Dyadobacter chenhuakuii]MCF2499999.1 DEAD/DEAH box helicase [Dyadobacter chenhuakuii]MCF2520240.1 DEAD/DEAH box helicase [Dyadobacter sp. CY351]USJ29568.1 DEAD/DEAH box helicase [Dyadobacter chenhuakuii]